jgi:SAM-dependent methyltransferase
MIFDAYAAYYDLLYKDKDYSHEANYVHDLIVKHHPAAKSILDMGCGTGKHAREFERFGYNVVGVDLSSSMISIANENYSSSTIEFYEGDLRTVRLAKKFDVVVALFHVMSYQTEDADIENALETASLHLNDDGLLIFDCWYGPGVLNDPPAVRVKEMMDEQIEVRRLAEPTLQPEKKIVNVHYNVEVKEKETNTKYIIKEKHSMRYFFSNEIEKLSALKKFNLVAAYKWLDTKKLDGESCWNVAFVLKKIGAIYSSLPVLCAVSSLTEALV